LGGCERIKYNAISFLRVEGDLTGLVVRTSVQRVQGPGETNTKMGVIFLGRWSSMSLHTHLLLLRVLWPSWIPVHGAVCIHRSPPCTVLFGD
jgi:hypothetical protein